MEGRSEAAMVNTGGLHWQRSAGDPSSFIDWIEGELCIMSGVRLYLIEYPYDATKTEVDSLK